MSRPCAIKTVLDSTLRSLLQKVASLVPPLILIVSLCLAAITLMQAHRAETRLDAEMDEENRLNLDAQAKLVEDYFDAIHSTLLFISFDQDMETLSKNAGPHIRRIYDYQWKKNRLTEIYIVEKEFSGNAPPIMKFEHEVEEDETDSLHSEEREKEEYETDIRFMALFKKNKKLGALLSKEIKLCVPESTKPDSAQSRGYIYSVPIRKESDGALVGLVAGMFRSESVNEALSTGSTNRLAFLVRNNSEIFGDMEAAKKEFELSQSRDEALDLDAVLKNSSSHKWEVLRKKVHVVSGETWYLHLMVNQNAVKKNEGINGWLAHSALSITIILAGCFLAILVRMYGNVLKFHAERLDERRRLESDVQEAIDREQRNIGQILRDDVCQRLAGIHAITKLSIQRTLLGQNQWIPNSSGDGDVLESSQQSVDPQSALSGEASAQIRGVLTSVRGLADQLQPVTLIQNGFCAALRELCETTKREHGIDYHVEDWGAHKHLNISVSTQLYRIAQEAFRNITAHSRASKVTILLSMERNSLLMRIQDDGVGFKDNEINRSGFGFRIMRYRAEMIEASLDVSSDSNGTTVLCTVNPQ